MPLGVCAKCLRVVLYTKPVGFLCAVCEWTERRRAEECDTDPDGGFLDAERG